MDDRSRGDVRSVAAGIIVDHQESISYDPRTIFDMHETMIGVIGQGWVGGSYANNFEKRGLTTVRYGLEPQYVANRDRIALCDVVFIAVPTPTTPDGFDDGVLRSVLPLVGVGKTAIIKSTILPGSTARLQEAFPHCKVMHSPEFLTEVTAQHDADNPKRNIIGIPVDDEEYRAAAQRALDVMPKAPFELICPAVEAEFVKYGGNGLLYLKVVFINALYDLAAARGANWETVSQALAADPRLGATHLNPIHKSGRGAGGHCFIKDFEALRQMYQAACPDEEGAAFFRAAVEKNNRLLVESGKDLDLLKGVYGEDAARSRTA